MLDLDAFLSSDDILGGIAKNDTGLGTSVSKSGGMLSPSIGDMHIDRALTQISVAFLQNMSGFVATRAFPTVNVTHRSDSYWEYPRGEFNLDQMEERAPGAESAGANYNVVEKSYNCKVRALHVDVADQVRANADAAFNLDRDATEFLTLKDAINREVTWANAYFQSGQTPGQVWSFVADGIAGATTATDFTNAGANDVQQWNQPTSNPIEIVKTGIRTVQGETGFRPNVMVMGREVFDVLTEHPDVIGRIDAGQTPNGPAIANAMAVSSLFGIDEILIMDGIVNAAKVGLPAQHGFIGGKNALLLYRPSSPGLMTPAAGYNFNWTGFIGANGNGTRIKNIRIEVREADRIEIQSSYDQRKVATDLGFFFNNIVA